MVKRVSYLGPEGTWSELCSKLWFPEYEPVPCTSFEEAVDRTETGQSDICVIPMENSTEGPVTQVMDIITDSPLLITGEKIMNIRHSLLSNSSEIKRIYSHPQAIAQCRKTIHKLYPLAMIEPVSSTAKMWKEASSDQGTAIIGSPLIASMYKIKIINNDVSDYPVNLTRFVSLCRSTKESRGNTKASLYFSLSNDGPGTLVSAIRPLSERGIKLSMITSIPNKNYPGTYNFFIDCTDFHNIEKLYEAMDEMKHICSVLKIKGIYERSEWNMPDF